MGLMMEYYAKYIFPRVLEAVMTKPPLMRIRRELLSSVNGQILEVGFGTGINLECYPPYIRRLTAIDINPSLVSAAHKRLAASGIAVDIVTANAESLPFPDSTFDSVVSTFNFCSIVNVDAAIGEIHRVLKPGGHLFFVDHGISTDERVRQAQHFLTPIFKILGCGCHLNRDIRGIIEKQPFKFISIEQFYQEDELKISGYLYKGIVEKVV